MTLLKQKIIEKIKSEGPINFETFMEMCLYYPGLGYYTKETTKIGRAGDFYTSPHLHRIFGAMLGKQMEEMWNLMGKPDSFNIIEIGAGMGYLAKDMLDYLKNREFYQHLKYSIVELNPFMKAEQQKMLAEYIDKLNWVSSLNELDSVTGCFISNELLDAFPVRMVEMDDSLMEIYVSVKDDEFIELKMPCSSEIIEYLKDYSAEISKRYRTEVNLKLKDWLADVNTKLSKGFILTIDYGYNAKDYYNEERNRGTLLCYYHHEINENPYQHVGEQDLTAHVNFSSLKRWGEELGLKTIGFCPQGSYLISLGIDGVITELYGDSPDSFEIAKIKGLIFPQGMGESHKVMVQYKGEGMPVLNGFGIRNQSERL
jgi:SAM-dependent MidA family methyltransferase